MVLGVGLLQKTTREKKCVADNGCQSVNKMWQTRLCCDHVCDWSTNYNMAHKCHNTKNEISYHIKIFQNWKKRSDDLGRSQN